MTISDEQLKEDKEFVDSDAFFILHGRVRLRAYISEVERLQSLLDDKVCAEVEFLREKIEKLQAENARLTSWVNDLQSGMFVNCVYCGHRYGPKGDTPTSMADILKEHITQCSQHPLSIALAENAELKKAILWIEPWAYIAIDQMDSSKLAAGRLADLKKVKALVDIT